MAHIYGSGGSSAFQIASKKREDVLWRVLIVVMYGAMGLGVLCGSMFLRYAWIR